MAERYPGYDVLSKRDTVSWNEQTRRVIDERLSIDPNAHSFLSDAEWLTLRALCDRIIPQPQEREKPVPLAAMLDRRLTDNAGDGYRDARLPPLRDAWRRGLAALDAEAMEARGVHFHALSPEEQDALLARIQEGEVNTAAWAGLPATLFFAKRVLHDIVGAYYAHPHSWNEIGFGGPASPRGYVRMNYDRRDPWEASEAHPGRERQARRENEHVGRT